MTVDLERVLRDLAPRLFRYAIGRIGDAGLAEDVAQECLTALVQRWQRHGPPESAEAFVFAIARRRAFRAAVRRRMWLPIEHLVGAATAGRIRSRPRSRGTRGRTRWRQSGSCQRATERCCCWSWQEALSTAQAADTLGISPSALKVRTFRARQRLAALMEDGNGARP